MKSVYSTYWYKVAQAQPRLRSNTRLSRHEYRGETWYVLRDTASGRQHRFNRTAYYFLAAMDGEKTLQEIWDDAIKRFGDEALTQDEAIQLLGQLHRTDLLQSNMLPDTLKMFERRKEKRSSITKQRLNPFVQRFPLINPDRFLHRKKKFIRPFFSKAFLVIWLLVVGAAAILAVTNWQQLTHDISSRVLTPGNLFLLWLVFPVVKLLHELGHAFAIKLWGGEVHEMGIMLLALTPIPYVEGSAAAAFPEKKKRMAVAGAGMMVELFLAALALFLWLNVEPGKVSAAAFNIMLIGGVSTLLFNGNPLMRFDGYYLLADWLEIPNLYKRSSQFLGYLFNRYILGQGSVQSPVTALGEKGWFLFYGIASFCYRLFITFSIAFFVSTRFPVVGILIALWGLTLQIFLPAVRQLYRFTKNLETSSSRKRSISAVAVLLLCISILVFVIPVPLTTISQGVVAPPENSHVRAGADCFITTIFIEDGSTVKKGDELLHCQDPFLDANIRMLKAEMEEARATYQAEPLHSRTQRDILTERIATVQAQLDHAQAQQENLSVYSPADGVFITRPGAELSGRHVYQGEELGYVLGGASPHVVVVVPQDDMELVQKKTRRIEIRLTGKLNDPVVTTIERTVPAASSRLPSPALGINGGGVIPVDPGDPSGLTPLSRTFQYEIRLPRNRADVYIGERAYALFHHGYEPVAFQWYRSLRHLLLGHFNV